MASDVSFRLPSFDTSPLSAYSVQSDLDASASEFEETGSTVGYEAQLDVISKEKLYDAYKKSLERYQKYRGRYTDLVRRYRDLERDNNKARVSTVYFDKLRFSALHSTLLIYFVFFCVFWCSLLLLCAMDSRC